jgi:hypothetical protein
VQFLKHLSSVVFFSPFFFYEETLCLQLYLLVGGPNYKGLIADKNVLISLLAKNTSSPLFHRRELVGLL